jgi:hypothetical protein
MRHIETAKEKVEGRKGRAIRAKATKETVAGPTATERARELTKKQGPESKAKAAGTTAVGATTEEEVMTGAGAVMAVVTMTTGSAITTKAHPLMCRREDALHSLCMGRERSLRR